MTNVQGPGGPVPNQPPGGAPPGSPEAIMAQLATALQALPQALQQLNNDEKTLQHDEAGGDPAQITADANKVVTDLAAVTVDVTRLSALVPELALQALVAISSPDLPPPSPSGKSVLSPTGIGTAGSGSQLSTTGTGQTSSITPPSGFAGNAWLGGLVSVVLAEVMALVFKSDAMRQLQDVALWIATQALLKDVANNIANADIEKGKAEFNMYIAMAVMTAATAAASLVCSFKSSAAGGPNTAGGAKWAGIGQAANSFGQIGDDIIQGATKLQTSKLDAYIEIAKNLQQMLQSVADRLTQDQKDAGSDLDSAIQNLMKWIDSLTKAFSKLGPQ